MTRRTRGERPGAACPLLAAFIVIVAFVAGAPADATAQGVVVSSASLSAGAVGEQIALPDGRLIDLRGLVAGAPVPAHGEGQLLVHDLVSRTTTVASSDLGLQSLIARDAGTSTYLGALLTAPGDVVVYESTTRLDTDVFQAERFIQASPQGGGGFFYADPRMPVPEAGMPLGMAVGVLALLRRVRARAGR